MQIVDNGEANEIKGEHSHIAGLVTFNGDRNRLVLGKNLVARNCQFTLGCDSSIEISDINHLGIMTIAAHDQSHVRIGSGCGFGETTILLHEPSRVTIGAGMLGSFGIKMTTSDMHAIWDRKTGARINLAADIDIGEHVWLAESVKLLKGAKVGMGSVIGSDSTVTGEIPARVIAVGRPARVVREDIEWTFTLTRPEVVG